MKAAKNQYNGKNHSPRQARRANTRRRTKSGSSIHQRGRARAVLERIELWKKWTMATFGWLALVIAIIVALIIELGAVKRVWWEMFRPGSATSLEVPASKITDYFRLPKISSIR